MREPARAGPGARRPRAARRGGAVRAGGAGDRRPARHDLAGDDQDGARDRARRPGSGR